MSYSFQPDQYYRMPTHFGPSLGPRQGLNGRRYTCTDTPESTIVEASFVADATQLEHLLPPGFTLRLPASISFCFEYFTNIEWLAGRGYNTFGVSVPVRYQGEEETVDGNLLLVLWENKADPIITGREDIGFAKVYCELPELQMLGDKLICRASWDGFEFARLTLDHLKLVSEDKLPATEPSAGTLHYKYIPKTGVPGEADVAYAALTPAGGDHYQLHSASVAETACLNLNPAAWEQLPTLVHIVNRLSELTIGKCSSAIVVKGHGGKDLSDQRILR